MLRTTLFGTLLLIVAFVIWVSSRPGMQEVGIPYAEAALPSEKLTVRWLGVATLLFDDGETQIMTDGFVSRPSGIDLLFKRPISPDIKAITRAIDGHDISRLAAIIPLHSHYDHAMDSADFARITGADLIGSAFTANIARASSLAELQIKQVRIGIPYTYGQFTITFYPSKHAPLITYNSEDVSTAEPFTLPASFRAYKEGKSYTIHIDHPQGSALVQGSAGFIPGVLHDLEVDSVFLGVGGLITLSAEYTSAYVDALVHAVNPKQVYIIHQDNLIGEFGNVEQNKLIPSFNKEFADYLFQQVLPAQLMQMSFGVDIAMSGEETIESAIQTSL